MASYASHPTYLHQIQPNFSHLSQTPSQHQQQQQPQQLPSSYESQSKNVHRASNGGQASVYGYPGEQYHRPLPAHSSIPNPSARNAGSAAASLPVPPAHMRSHPYQASSYSHHLAAPYNHYPGYPASPYHGPVPVSTSASVDKLSLPSSHSLNGSGGGGVGPSPYYQPTPDPKDFSRRSEKLASADSVKNLSSSSQQQQQQQSVAKTSVANYTYPYNVVSTSSSTPYNYHQNLYSGPQPQYHLSYSSVPRPPTALPSAPVDVRKAAGPDKVQDRAGAGSNKVTYSTLQQPSYESEKPSSYSLSSSAPVNDIYHNLNPPSGNGYAPHPPSTTSATSTNLQQQRLQQQQQQQQSHNNLLPPSLTTTSYLSQSLNAPIYSSPLSLYQPQLLQQQQQQQQKPQHLPPAPALPQFYHPSPQQDASALPRSNTTPVPPAAAAAAVDDQDEDLPLAGKKESWKRKSSSAKSSEPKHKHFKKDDQSAFKDDPYAFNDDDDGSGGKDPTGLDFSGRSSRDRSANTVYKFKNALLTRTAESYQQVSNVSCYSSEI